MNWILLFLAIVFEVAGTSCLKLSVAMTKLLPTLGVFVFYALSFFLLSLVLRKIDVSVAYAVWSGLGIVFITLIDIFVFRTALSPLKVFSIALIVVGAVLLKLLTTA